MSYNNPYSFPQPRAQVFLCLSIILGLSIAFSWIFWKAFPYGAIHNDTGAYFYLAEDFHVFQPNGHDWIRTIPFGAVLRASTFFENPTVAVYWFHATLFALSMALTFWFVTIIFRSIWSAFVLTILLIFLEAFFMHTFYWNTAMLSDSLYTYLVFTGTLLALGSWIRKSSLLSYSAYGLFGFAAFTKPIGVCLFPLWAAFAFITFRTKGKNGVPILQWKKVVLSGLLLLGPVTIWSSRNFMLYGHFKMTSVGSLNLLGYVMPLMEDSDIIFSDNKTNDRFIATVRKFESTVGKKMSTYLWGGTTERPGPRQYIMQLTKSYRGHKEDKSTLNYVKMEFETWEIGKQIALRIIQTHTWKYLKLVTHNYIVYFSYPVYPQNIMIMEKRYKWALEAQKEWQKNLAVALHPPEGKIDLSLSNETFRNALKTFCCDNSIQRFLVSRKNWLSLFPFLIFIFSYSCYLLSQSKSTKFIKRTNLQAVSIAMIMLFLNAAVHYAAAAAVHAPAVRHSLPGEMGLNLMYLLALYVIISSLFHWFSQYLSPRMKKCFVSRLRRN